jgi:proteic killer suppression protein
LTIPYDVYILFNMWQIYEKKSLIKTMAKIPSHILKHYEVWKQILLLQGPQGLRLIKGFHDESLKGIWEGYRSSRLTREWRVIYKIENQQCEIYVIDINHHDYRR